MRITPLDIQQKQFPVKFRGFDTEGVLTFLELLREEMMELLKENAFLKERTQKANKKLGEFQELEGALNGTIREAHQMAEEYRNTARKDADLMIQKAENMAENSVNSTLEEIQEINMDIRELRRIRQSLHEEVKKVLEKHTKMAWIEREGTV